MEPKKPGSNKLPDFDQLNDRIIAESPEQPMLVIRTNLDPSNSTEDNPYYKNKQETNTKQFRDYFEK